MIFSTSFSDTLEPACAAADRGSRAGDADAATAQDADLVKRFNSGDEAAFVEIVDHHRAHMFAIALSLLRNYADAEEVAQDTFVRAYRGLAHFRGEASLGSWLHCIALNLSRNRYRGVFRRRRHEADSLDRALGDEGEAVFADRVASDVPDPASEAVNREFSEHVAVCMGKLGARQREILDQRSLLGRSYEEIGEALGLTVGTVKSRLARAREDLRGLLARTYAEPKPGTSFSLQCFEPKSMAAAPRSHCLGGD